jgi:IclR family transcriptional regulator, KDG regulon repressor
LSEEPKTEVALKQISNAPRTVEKALDILEALVDAGAVRPLGVTELSKMLKIHKSTVYRSLHALSQKGYVHQESGTNKYFLSFKLIEMGTSLLRQVPLREICKSTLKTLAEETSQVARLGLLDGDDIVYIEHVEGKDPLRLHTQIGSRIPVYCTAAGKSILAFLPENDKEAILDECRFQRFTPQTITDRMEFEKELESVRKNCFSISDEEFREGIRAVGAPIFNMDAMVIGAIVIVASSFRLRQNDIPLFGERIKKAALEISRKMGYPFSATHMKDMGGSDDYNR